MDASANAGATSNARVEALASRVAGGSPGSAPLRALEADPNALTPAGLQSRRALRLRRATLAGLCLASLALILWAVAGLLGAGGWSGLDIGIAAAIALSAPATVVGFWTAVIGFALRRLSRDPLALVAPHWRGPEAEAETALTGRTALLMTLRNEDPERAFRRLLALRADLDRRPDGRLFDFFILSDSSRAEIVAEEERLFGAHQGALDGLGRATYRRRPVNTDYKAGNIRDWVERWGDDYAFMAPLDADSLMSAEALRRLQRVVERHPRLGVLQSLCLGAPATSPFGRLFQFGTRLGHRVHAIGASWWQGDCGPFWGHNAVIRVAAFKRWCRLPRLKGAPPLGGPILSHDQVEAALMRRGGYEVRLAPVEAESFEESPVNVLDFLKREVRWANGNLQYGPLLGLARLRPTSRFQLLLAMLNYIAPAAWMAMIALAMGKLFEPAPAVAGATTGAQEATIAIALFFAMLGMSLAPKALGAVDLLFERGGLRRFGGGPRFAVSFLAEILFSMILAPIAAFRIAAFVIGLPFGKKLDWGGQQRDAYRLSLGEAMRGLWPQTLLGLAMTALIAATAPGVLPWSAPVLLGLTLAAPLTALTASPKLGAAMARARLAASPEEIEGRAILAAVERIELSRAAAPERAAP